MLVHTKRFYLLNLSIFISFLVSLKNCATFNKHENDQSEHEIIAKIKNKLESIEGKLAYFSQTRKPEDSKVDKPQLKFNHNSSSQVRKIKTRPSFINN